eukprot:Phypoly_transcript_17524.p1 GENE.Phypoly_transcript_17524~~Phypoly_transcript_17524.p1  ORF type:complete len:207 (+),score=19.19 Phypoly_transcript_17524:86-706(+)
MSNRKSVLGVFFPGMFSLDFNGPQTAMHLAWDPANGNKSFYDLETVALKGNKTSIITSENIQVIADYTLQTLPQKKYDILLIPGGRGVREYVNDEEFLGQLKVLIDRCTMVFTVCTGAALLARTGLLDGKAATSNKISWDWVTSQGPNVKWTKKRWVDAEYILSSAGVSAGIDAGLYLISKQYGREIALAAAERMEYHWNEDGETF